MLSEEPPYGATDKPTELYAIIEHFCQGRRRLELFGEDTNIRRGWLTLGSSLSSSNHDPQRWFANFEGTIESHNFDDEVAQTLPNHLLGTTPQIESLRPKSPTQLREEAERRHRREVELYEQERREFEVKYNYALANGLEVPVFTRQPPQMVPQSFREQSPFMAPNANKGW